ncbi:TlpA family protein disulfide reductase [Marinibactrum halimedae]|uniref:Thiol:disulfide interchange protein n=1 Tax=Marinibactrum halimedae TaxID=1444977 RepID=A0AA37T7S4_9GAMM|nr:TlpA disulfide reductase family protein [Marinibactrum halimedae]MCD9457776.1 TlpA family protein disulfide reductase [Marinibactrum halimedae]GLS24850.1 thiol:disulfide interchange protein [Marinibactrum halimedae]
MTTSLMTRVTPYLTAIMFSLLTSSALAATTMNKTAPDFTLKSNQGKNFRLSEHRGDVLFINFWASWCGPCRQEMPILEELHSRYSSAGFKVVGISIDEDEAAANGLLKKIPVSFPVLYDTTSKVSELFDVDAMPTSVLVDRNGKMRFLHRGYKPGFEDDYRAQIRELIKE